MRSFPDISRNIKNLSVGGPSILGRWTHPKRLNGLDVVGKELKRLTHVPESVRKLNLSSSGIEMIPDYVRGLRRLQTLIIEKCTKLMSVEGLPPSLKSLHADNCVSLERVQLPSGIEDPIRELMFSNCLRLDEKARRVIINRRLAKYVCLPGKQVPAESITLSLRTFYSAASSRFKDCLLLLPIKDNALLHVTCYLRSEEGVLINQMSYMALTSDQPPQVRTRHLFILPGDLLHQETQHLEVDVNTSEILFEFTCSDNHKIIECGVRILEEEDEKRVNTEWWFQHDQINIGDNTNDHTEYHNDDDDGGDCEPEAVENISYEKEKAEAVEVSQVENVGNNNYLFTLSKADSSTYGIDFGPSNDQSTGRFTNGQTISDIVGTPIYSFSNILYVLIQVSFDICYTN